MIIPAASVTLSAALIQHAGVAHALGLSPLHLDDWALAAFGALIAVVPLLAVSRRGGAAPRGTLAPATESRGPS